MKTIRIMRKEIDLDGSNILLKKSFLPELFRQEWKVYGGNWSVEGEWLTGINPENNPGMVVSKGDYPGNILLDFEARTVLPSTHDIDCMWNGSWDEKKNRRDVAYVAGLQGWWEGKVGFEKSPEYKLWATTPLFPFVPGQIYRMLAGSIDGHAFIFVDGRLVLEVRDPEPIDSHKHAKIGFEAYSSHIQIRNLVVRQIKWHPLNMRYEPEF